MAQEIQQQIQFFKSKLNWDVDISLLQDGDSKYFLNTVPAASEHAGIRSNCLGTTEKSSFISIASPTTRTVTTTYPTTSTVYDLNLLLHLFRGVCGLRYYLKDR